MKRIVVFISFMIALSLLGCNIDSAKTADTTIEAAEYLEVTETLLSSSSELELMLADADVLRQSILNSPTEVDVTGTCYYVSNNGNDNNDGLTVETAWASLEKVSNANLNPGDAVFFERNGVFRGYLCCQNGVTYSAYGTGEKPVITGSPENGAGVEKWTLYGETDDGGKVWQYYREMQDCGIIVCNDFEEYCLKVVPYWSETGFVTQSGAKFDVLQELQKNLQFFSHADSLFPRTGGFYLLFDEQYFLSSGPLYLRCDQGNPGEVFENIEFGINPKACLGLVNMAAGCIVDNLSIRYTSDCGVMPGSARGDAVIQHCEIAWCGGGLWAYDDAGVPSLAGDGFSLIDGIIIENCYIHHNFYNGITIESGSDPGIVVSNVTAIGNLIDYNTGGIQIMCYDENMIANNITYRDFLIENNYILHSGESWSASLHSPDAAPSDDLAVGYSIRLGDINTPLCAPNTVIKNNVFYGKSVCNIWGATYGDENPQFLNNHIYIRQDAGAALWVPDNLTEFRWYFIEGEEWDAYELFNQKLGSGNIIEYIPHGFQ